MRTILVSATLFMTVIFSVSLGVISAYAVIHGILTAFGRQARPQEQTAPVLISHEAASEQGLSAVLSES